MKQDLNKLKKQLTKQENELALIFKAVKEDAISKQVLITDNLTPIKKYFTSVDDGDDELEESKNTIVKVFGKLYDDITQREKELSDTLAPLREYLS